MEEKFYSFDKPVTGPGRLTQKVETEEDIVLMQSPVGLPGRAVNNEFLKYVKEGHGDPVKTRCEQCLKECKKIFCIMGALERARTGDIKNGLVFCGERMNEIKDILSVKQIFKNLIAEYEATQSAVTSCG